MSNPNPSPATRFQKGDNGNPKGKTSEQKRLELSNAEKALSIREKILDAMTAGMDDLEGDELVKALLEHLNPNSLKMLKDAEDRGLGAPVQPITSPDGSMTRKPVDAALVEELAKKLTE